MLKDEAKTHVHSWAQKLSDLGVIPKQHCSISVRAGTDMVITPSCMEIQRCSPEDMIVVPLTDMACQGTDHAVHAALYNKRGDFNALIHTNLKNITTLSKAGITVPPLLDDMAQIVGASGKIAAYSRPVDETVIQSVLKAFRRRSAALLSGHGALCGAETFDDAHAVAQVLEKNCKACIESSFIGGGVNINAIEANLMRLVYRIKYSRQDVTNR